MKKTFALTTENGKLTCPELAGYELPEIRTARTPIAIEVEMVASVAYNSITMRGEDGCLGYYKPATNPDGTVKGTYIFKE
jgi:hypothetical protein